VIRRSRDRAEFSLGGEEQMPVEKQFESFRLEFEEAHPLVRPVLKIS